MERFLPKIFFPIFVPFTFWCWVLIVVAMSLDHSPSSGTGPSYSRMMDFAAICLAPVVAGWFQATVGLASLRLLRKVSRFTTFVVVGILLGLAMSILASWALATSTFGETMWTHLHWHLLIFVPSFVSGYALAYWAESHLPIPTDRGAIPASSEASKRGTSADAS